MRGCQPAKFDHPSLLCHLTVILYNSDTRYIQFPIYRSSLPSPFRLVLFYHESSVVSTPTTTFYNPFYHPIVPLFSVTIPRILPVSAVFSLHRCLTLCQFSSSLPVDISFCSRTHDIFHVYGITSTTMLSPVLFVFLHPVLPTRSTNPFYQCRYFIHIVITTFM